MSNNFDLLEQDAADVARLLLGAEFVRELDGQQIIGRIVETEAYNQFDAASHSYRGRTPRTEVMFGPAGHLYVYFTYGMHYCMNVVTGKPRTGSAVLIRALEPVAGLQTIRAHRQGISEDLQLMNGPAKLCKAMHITRVWNGHDLNDAPLQLRLHESLPDGQIVTSPRIGISRSKEALLRFYIKDNRFVSK